MGIRRKDEVLSHFGGITNSWECNGVPANVTTDAGRAFRSDGLLAASEALQFSIHFEPRRRSWLNGQIESWFKSIEGQLFETFPPTVFPAAYDRPGTGERPVLMLDEANWIVAKWIVDIYHQQVDPALACTPARMWNSGLRESPFPRAVQNDLLNDAFRSRKPRPIPARKRPPLGGGSIDL
jgi:transposase InsO family protein